MTRGCPATQPPTSSTLVELTQPPSTAYTIYVDGGWDTVNADFNTAFQEQRDPTNRRGSAGIAIVPTGPDWMKKGTILITLSDGSQIGSQPAHMELAAIIVGLAIRRWQLPPQQETPSTLTANPSRTSSRAQLPHSRSTQPNSPFFKRSYTILTLSALKESSSTGPNLTQNDGLHQSSTQLTTGAYYLPTAQHPTTQPLATSKSNNTSNSRSQRYSRPPSTPLHGL